MRKSAYNAIHEELSLDHQHSHKTANSGWGRVGTTGSLGLVD